MQCEQSESNFVSAQALAQEEKYLTKYIWACNPLFRLGKMRASATKYGFFLIKIDNECLGRPFNTPFAH